MEKIFKIYGFVFMICFCEVSGASEKIGNPLHRMRMKRRSIIERRDNDDNVQDNKRGKLDELLNAMEKDNEIERELDILKHWQDLSALTTRKEDTDNVEDKELGRDGLDLLKNTNKKNFRARRRHRWWFCPACGKSRAHKGKCRCPIPIHF